MRVCVDAVGITIKGSPDDDDELICNVVRFKRMMIEGFLRILMMMKATTVLTTVMMITGWSTD